MLLACLICLVHLVWKLFLFGMLGVTCLEPKPLFSWFCRNKHVAEFHFQFHKLDTLVEHRHLAASISTACCPRAVFVRITKIGHLRTVVSWP